MADLRGRPSRLKKVASFYVEEEDEKLLKDILEKGMELYVKGKNL